jgi:hypothetical protein
MNYTIFDHFGHRLCRVHPDAQRRRRDDSSNITGDRYDCRWSRRWRLPSGRHGGGATIGCAMLMHTAGSGRAPRFYASAGMLISGAGTSAGGCAAGTLEFRSGRGRAWNHRGGGGLRSRTAVGLLAALRHALAALALHAGIERGIDRPAPGCVSRRTCKRVDVPQPTRCGRAPRRRRFRRSARPNLPWGTEPSRRGARSWWMASTRSRI